MNFVLRTLMRGSFLPFIQSFPNFSQVNKKDQHSNVLDCFNNGGNWA